MRTIYVLEKEDVREKTEINGCRLMDEIYEAIDALKDFASGSIYDDNSEGYCYEDNICFFETQKDDLLKTLKSYRDDINGYIAELEKIEPCL